VTIPFHPNDSVDLIVIEDSIPMDPVFYKHLETLAKQESDPKNTKIAIISYDNISTYRYLYISGNRVMEKYLYDPIVVDNFSKKKQTESLWHKEKKPTFEEIKLQAKQYCLES
jgi:hypothetical protein